MLAATACGEGLSDLDVDTSDESDSALVGGTTTNLRPEVGRFLNGRGGRCTATLIHARYVLTAAHCLDYPNYANVTVLPGTAVEIAGRKHRVDRIHSFARYRYEFTSTGTPRMTTDVALVRLTTAVPATDARPASLASRMPRSGERVTLFGYGCGARGSPGNGLKQYFEFTFPNPTQALCPGDSGGPAFIGGRTETGQIWGVNSDYVSSGAGGWSTWNDVFGDVVGFKGSIERIMQEWDGGGVALTYSWVTGAYGACSQGCGGGTQTRAVTCRSSAQGNPSVAERNCNPATRPASSRSCNTQACALPTTRSFRPGQTPSAGGLLLHHGQNVETLNYGLWMQGDGNLVLYRKSDNVAVWHSRTGGRSCTAATPCRASFQGDGNLVLYQGSSVLWHTNTYGQGATALELRESAPYLSIVKGGQRLWSSQ